MLDEDVLKKDLIEEESLILSDTATAASTDSGLACRIIHLHHQGCLSADVGSATWVWIVFDGRCDWLD